MSQKKLIKKPREDNSFFEEITESENGSTDDEIISLIEDTTQSIETENKEKRKWDKHFSQLSGEELVKEYAQWKAKQRFLEFLHTTLQKYKTQEALPTEELEGIPNNKNKEFTTRRQALAIHYLNKHFKINRMQDTTVLAKFVQFLTGKNYDNIYKVICKPLKINADEKRTSAENALKKDLEYIKAQFFKLGLTQINDLIDKDLNSI